MRQTEMAQAFNIILVGSLEGEEGGDVCLLTNLCCANGGVAPDGTGVCCCKKENTRKHLNK